MVRDAAVKFAPEADPKRPWRTLTLSFGRMSFEDKTLNDNVRYARHAISIDENRAAFARVGWGDPHGSRPDSDADGFCTFEQGWDQDRQIRASALPVPGRDAA
jgi:Uncharacterized alpha/beta hydrolase domain (DUF2235)